MVAAIRHEPFYRTGTWIDESLGVYAGWTVIEDSFADGMPLRDRKRGLTLVFSGEEYGHRKSAAEGDESEAASL
jgi:asparagine synthase (glutamine-hydrolysing)